jgi:hypothetical protein
MVASAPAATLALASASALIQGMMVRMAVMIVVVMMVMMLVRIVEGC